MKSTHENIFISKVPIQHLHLDNLLYQNIFDLAAPSYVDPTALLKRDIANCDTLYLAYNSDAEVCAIFMVGQHSILLDGTKKSVYFLGLSATSTHTKNSGIVRALYQTFINDIQQLEQKVHHRIPLWHTTATPSTVHAVDILFCNNEPDIKGNYSQNSKQLALSIRQYKGWHYKPGTHPFVLKNIAENTRYSLPERARIDAICSKKQFTLFDDLDIQESNGDRLLRISYAPTI